MATTKWILLIAALNLLRNAAHCLDYSPSNDASSLKEELCRTLRCLPGEECVFDREDDVARCQCREYCPEEEQQRKTQVCAFGNKTYDSLCHLLIDNCLLHRKIDIIYTNGSCSTVSDGLTSKAGEIRTTTIKAPTTGSTFEPGSDTINKNDDNEQRNLSSRIGGTLKQRKIDPENDSKPKITICKNEDFAFIPSNLLLFYHSKYGTDPSIYEHKDEKSRLVDLLFLHLDQNGDKSITMQELDYLEDDQQYLKLMPPGCHLKDIIRFGDLNHDDKLDSTEFNKIFGLPIKSQPVKHTSIKVHQVKEGDQYQLYCTLDGGKVFSPLSYNRVTWYRYDVPFVNVVPYDFEVSADNSLYLTPASLVHNGEFRCKTFRDGASFEQKHKVRVTSKPVVRLQPQFVLLESGERLSLKCLIEKGFPQPKIHWQKNGVKLNHEGVLLSIVKTKPSDTGSYLCIATNDAGSSNASASVVVQNKYENPEIYLKKIENEKSSHFLLFDQHGIKKFDAHSCKSSKVVFSPMTNALPDSLLCGDSKKCNWSAVAKTASDESVYATLYDKKVLIRINVTSSKVEEVFHLNVVPDKLFYVHLDDTLWLESSVGGSKTDRGKMLIQIIKFASKDVKHSLTRYFSMTEEYDKSEKFFVPTNGDLHYGYMVIEKDMALHKFDMLTLRVVSRINLSPYNCHPNEIAFVAQNGLTIVDCSAGNRSEKSIGQLVLDFMSDSILSFDPLVTGLPIVTEDAKYVVTMQKSFGRMFMQNITEKSLSKAKIIDEFLPLDEFVILPGLNFEHWILYATSKFSNNMIGVEIPSGKINRLFNTKSSSNHSSSPVILESLNLDFLIFPDQSGFTVYKWQSPFENSTWSSSSPTNLFLQENCHHSDEHDSKISKSVRRRKLMIKLHD